MPHQAEIGVAVMVRLDGRPFDGTERARLNRHGQVPKVGLV
jgi:hypothetical protein